MALGHGSKIVTDGLVLALDAANPRSYPGSGTTWFDLSGNNHHFSLINNPTYSFEGYFIFDGVNDYIVSSSDIDLSSYVSITVEFYVKPSTDTNSTGIVFEHTDNWNTNPGGFGLAVNSNGGGYFENLCHTNHYRNPKNYNSTTNEGVWSFHSNTFTKVLDTSGRYSFLNGENADFTSSPYNGSTSSINNSFSNSLFYIGSRGGSSIFYDGFLSMLKVYGSKLDIFDHSKNFTATRGRYGI